MFTGIVERTANVTRAQDQGGGGRRLTLRLNEPAELPPWQAGELGESIAVNGVCLTVVEAEARPGASEVAFDVVPESLSRTTLGELRSGEIVNVERSLAVGDRLGGHYVTGHVDGVGTVRARRRQGDQVLYEIGVDPALARQIITKGSIAVDGISLTVVDVSAAGGWFRFAAIPHTLERTNLESRPVGSRVNVETDHFGKWVLQALEDIVGGGDRDQRLRRLLDLTDSSSANRPPDDKPVNS